jgi:hypothetical protein
MKYTEAMFESVQFMTAKEKFNVVKAMEKFLKNDFSETTFTDALYKHLTLHCGYIAHFNRNGYWFYYFDPESPESVLSWAKELVSSFDQREYKDINNIIKEMVDQKMKDHIQVLNKKARERDLAAAEKLLNRHGFMRVSAHPDRMHFEMVAR